MLTSKIVWYSGSRRTDIQGDVPGAGKVLCDKLRRTLGYTDECRKG